MGYDGFYELMKSAIVVIICTYAAMAHDLSGN